MSQVGSVTVVAGAVSTAVAGVFDGTGYQAAVSTSWLTDCQISAKTTSGFTVTFGTPAPVGGGTVDWTVVE